MSDPVELAPDSVEAVAQRVAELLGRPARSSPLVTVRELARQLGVGTDYVYEHARELGAMQLGTGRRARLRFDVDTARRALEDRRRRPRGRPRASDGYGR